MDDFDWHGRRALVTGATGVVGAWVVKDLLAKGADVTVLIRDDAPQSELVRCGDIGRVRHINGPLEDFSVVERAIAKHEVDTIFHLAAQPIVGVAKASPMATFETNIRGTYHLLEAARLHRGRVERVVVASSDKAYGRASEPYRETMPLNGRQPYEVSKSCADLLATSYAETYDLPIAIARCANIYGGGDLNWSRIVPGTLRSLIQGETPIVRSDGTLVREYVYVEDVVSSYMSLAENLNRPDVRGQAFNFTSGQVLTVLDMVGALCRVHGQSVEPRILGEAQDEIPDQRLDGSKAASVLGWHSRFTLDDGLQKTVAWYANFFASAV